MIIQVITITIGVFLGMELSKFVSNNDEGIISNTYNKIKQLYREWRVKRKNIKRRKFQLKREKNSK